MSHKCSYFRAATSICLRPVQAVIHFVGDGQRRFERACKDHYAEITERIRQAGHEIVEVASACCYTDPVTNKDCCGGSLR